MACPIVCFWVFRELDMVLESLSANEQVCVSVFLKIWHEVSGTGDCWHMSRAWS